MKYHTIIIGTGAAGYNAADTLAALGVVDIALFADSRTGGTSRNAGSDKQTYYKLSLAGGRPDSVWDMARTLYNGGAMDGDLALCEAALSAQCFLKLAGQGVAFPKNAWGEYVGYRTDHDERRRASSVGPYTSRRMVEALEDSVVKRGIPIIDNTQLVRVLTENSRVCGALYLCGERDFAAVECANVILATGGPGELYAESVYPAGQYGALGVALEAGAAARNLTEWQYGIASRAPRWNLSGSYMQVMPRFYSTDKNGNDEQAFLDCDIAPGGPQCDAIFQKGYHWPLDVRRAGDSSRIDLAVAEQTAAGRRVFLDFRQNPGGGALPWDELSEETRGYLAGAGVDGQTPIQRLQQLNAPAIDFYMDHGVDLALGPLEIAVCAQHCNGGLAVDTRWRTALPGLYAVGEAAGTHGIYRPGGSALNAGQAGAVRAAEDIARQSGAAPGIGNEAGGQIQETLCFAQALQASDADCSPARAERLIEAAQRRMSDCGGVFRSAVKIKEAIGEIDGEIERVLTGGKTTVSEHEDTFENNPSSGGLSAIFRLKELLTAQRACLTAMLDYSSRGGASRGGAFYEPNGEGIATDMIQELSLSNGEWQTQWRKANPLPQDDAAFEKVWREYREAN
ncbi:MAG: FAD-binding protein [Clostridia bacterium]|nr:FAD-binding protein [Clostridia bacterium]